MSVFLDFEASSLSKHSYPIEVAWVFEDGRARSFLIKRIPGWTDWSSEAEALHGISREQLARDGVDVSTIVSEMVETLADHDLSASAPSWDGKWLSALLRAAGNPSHELRLRKSDEAFLDLAKEVAGSSVSDKDIEDFVSDIIERTEPSSPPHRALPDALLELDRWKLVREEARDLQAKRP
ncbi:transcriptional regulator [Rhizobium deserti]|uniref:Transcriptional regulator n=1 Tax=Rhizobium deserti TaxID=2547961 RepID=A0A4R5U9K1_9HYPH|nr:transcriptional regulator [Rhizobium deserti]TDK31283.1 transcriptional regulator [Rhizobium deserti]